MKDPNRIRQIWITFLCGRVTVRVDEGLTLKIVADPVVSSYYLCRRASDSEDSVGTGRCAKRGRDIILHEVLCTM